MIRDGRPCIYLTDEILGQGICDDLKEVGTTEKWLMRVAHICKVANDSGVPVVLESEHPMNDVVRSIIGIKNLAIPEKMDP
jgi:hypothetical protein